MAPIRVGLTGLSTFSSPDGTGGWTMAAHLPSLLASPHYEIVGLLNSTVESAQRSIEFHNLGPNVKAYGSPEDLANDPNVDLVVVTVKLANHYAIAKAAIAAGKDIFVEWPHFKTTPESEEMTLLAKKQGIKTIVGLQARADPVLHTIKSIIDSGKIGKVLSSTVVSFFPNTAHPMWPASVKMYFEKDSGLNILTINFGHYFTTFLGALGPFEKFSSVLETKYPTTNLVSPSGEVVEANFKKTGADHIFILGKLTSGAVASFSFRATQNTIDGKGMRWIIGGTEGEIEITTPELVWHQMDGGQTIRVRKGDSKAEEVDLTDPEEPDHVANISGRAKNTARLYEAFATGKTDRYTDFEQATEEQRILDDVYKNAL